MDLVQYFKVNKVKVKALQSLKYLTPLYTMSEFMPFFDQAASDMLIREIEDDYKQIENEI